MATHKDSEVIVRQTQRADLPEVIAMIQELADFEKMPAGPELTVDDLIRDGGFDEHHGTANGAPVFHSFVLEAPADPEWLAANQERLTSMRSVDPANARPLTRMSSSIQSSRTVHSNETLLMFCWSLIRDYTTVLRLYCLSDARSGAAGMGKSLALEDIYIRPAYRGNGYGELFFRALAKHAQESRCSRIDFHVLSWNPATSFYRRMGALDLTEAESWHFYRLQKDAIDLLARNNMTTS
uniref:N-acetyltransferase domain-containing protein n=1 Tax=Anopheles culicifacies TaxID=139723 RepID=A0A182MPC3_9DIPT